MTRDPYARGGMFLLGVILGAFAGTIVVMRGLWDRADGQSREDPDKARQVQLAAIDSFWRDLERVDSV